MNNITVDSSEERLLWIDMEMTGLDPVEDHVLKNVPGS